MNALRQIIKPKGRFISLELPEEFESNSEVEVIVLPSEKTPQKINKKSNILALQKGLFANIDILKKQKMLSELDNLRNEWERDIL
jgi:hypothetical protein